MIDRIVQLCLKNRVLVLLVYLMVTGWGIWSVLNTPVDAIPDLSENQVIVLAEWPGRSAQEVEDQITYPLSTSMQGLPGVKEVRAQSAFGFGMLTVIFRDDIDLYWARTRVLERLNSLPFALPENVTPVLGPDATSIGWIYQYYLDDTKAREMGKPLDLGELRSLQDWYVRYQLQSVPGVAEVASIGGYVKQYQIDVDPNLLRAHGMSLTKVIQAVKGSNANVGGGNIEVAGREYTIRGLALVEDLNDLRDISLGYHGGRPIQLRDVATVNYGPEARRGALDKDGREIVGGIIVMRQGETTIDVIDAVEAKMKQLQPGLPPGVELKSFYDRSDLIFRAIKTLRNTLIEEMILVTLAHVIFLAHFRSVLIVTIPLPLSILIAFILMKEFGITSNIMSLSGLAIAIGVLVDAAVVVTEAVMREAHKVQLGQVPGLQYPRDMPQIVRRATGLVARPIFYAMMIIILAFLPVFALTGEAGKLFHPLAWMKTFAMAGATLLAVTFVPVLASFFIRGQLHDENANPIMWVLLWLYVPVLRFALRVRWLILLAAVLVLATAIWCGSRLGWDDMPKLNERALLFMPTTLPSASLPEIKRTMAAQDKALAAFPEVESAVGKLGRAETATDPAPISMIETTIMLKPMSEWRPGMTQEKLRMEMEKAMMDYPGFRPAMLQPIENRILMLNTGIRGEVAVKIFGDDLETLEKLALDVEKVLKTVPGAKDVYGNRSTLGAQYLEINIMREEAAQYGVPIGEITSVIETAIGGKNLSLTIEGRERYPIRVRYARELRNNPAKIGNVLVTSMNGQSIPLSKVADIRLVKGPSVIESENGMLRTYVQANVDGPALLTFIRDAQKVIDEKIDMPPGTFIAWGGRYEQMMAAYNTFMIVIPVVLLIIFIMLYLIYRSWAEAAHVLLAVPFALSGGLFLQWWMGYNFSVAVIVGYIALFGTAVQTGVVMVIYLEEAVRKAREKTGDLLNRDALREAVLEGAALRLRPKVMTVATVVASMLVILLPGLSEERTGIEVMRPIAVPVLGGMISSLLHILIVTPVIFLMLQERKVKRKPAREAES